MLILEEDAGLKLAADRDILIGRVKGDFEKLPDKCGMSSFRTCSKAGLVPFALEEGPGDGAQPDMLMRPPMDPALDVGRDTEIPELEYSGGGENCC